jgi:hypothetical protein
MHPRDGEGGTRYASVQEQFRSAQRTQGARSKSTESVRVVIIRYFIPFYSECVLENTWTH